MTRLLQLAQPKFGFQLRDVSIFSV